jgi:hypothetical protein
MFAAGEFSAVQEAVALAMRILLTVIGTLLAWVLAAPVARIVYRLILRRPIPPKVLTGSRMVAAIVCGVLVFLLFPLGYGGGGGGSGGGKGPGVGSGSANGTDKGGRDSGGKRPEAKLGEPGETLRIEMIPSARYKPESGRWYLIDGKEPPQTLAEVDAYLKKHKARVRRLDILIPVDSVDRGHPAVQALADLAQRQYDLPVYRSARPADKNKSK